MATADRTEETEKNVASPGKQPRTARGRATMRRLLDAAAKEFGERGFHEASISGITRRAGTALGSFYTYFDSKEAIFSALVKDMSEGVAKAAAAGMAADASGVEREREALAAFLGFARQNKEIYRIIDEAEFADPASYRDHYEGAANRIAARLDAAVENGDVAPGDNEVRAWAIMGMNVFLGLRFGVWDDTRPVDDITGAVAALLGDGLGR
ncbi:TetR/AcrR family transcriptional regulator [Tsuneonella flava]|uniref:TetR/AcrR family transcriptional regulator n=1 Tax=Tsuneonella flava TaxID=2055955 RepID=A0ABX7K8S5_9SPHN|nr:TetR/AcrR family transcriptional regulator [Tsuneonella flava]QSB44661.1 TetR/AcrR family transcriptional regulator [Tsuneonella flava]